MLRQFLLLDWRFTEKEFVILIKFLSLSSLYYLRRGMDDLPTQVVDGSLRPCNLLLRFSWFPFTLGLVSCQWCPWLLCPLRRSHDCVLQMKVARRLEILGLLVVLVLMLHD